MSATPLEGLKLEVWRMKDTQTGEGTQGGSSLTTTTTQELRDSQDLVGGPQAGSSYHVRVILGCEGRQLDLRGRSSRDYLVKRQETSSVNQTREQNRALWTVHVIVTDYFN